MKVKDLEALGFPAPDNVFFEGRGASWNDQIGSVPLTHGVIEVGTEITDHRVDGMELIFLHRGRLAAGGWHNPPDTAPIILRPNQDLYIASMPEHEKPARNQPSPLAIYTCFIVAANKAKETDPGYVSLVDAIAEVRAQQFPFMRGGNETPHQLLTRIHNFRTENLAAVGRSSDPR